MAGAVVLGLAVIALFVWKLATTKSGPRPSRSGATVVSKRGFHKSSVGPMCPRWGTPSPALGVDLDLLDMRMGGNRSPEPRRALL